MHKATSLTPCSIYLKAREFHARPLPCLSPDLIPVKSGKHTDVAPFNLATDERGALKTEKFTAQVSIDFDLDKIA